MKTVKTLLLLSTYLMMTGCATPNAVKEDSKVAWEGTKEASGEVWEGTKKVTNDTWQGTKKVVHDVTD